MTLLAELIEIPSSVSQGDFVLKLGEGVADPKTTIDSYVVTPQLVRAFGDALDLVSAAVSQGKSRAAYLHGSFGSGKSHFMAVLHALLQHEPAARAKIELADVIADHDQVLLGKRFLLVPLHLIGATSLESAIFEGYLDRIGQVAPEAPLPPLFVAEPVFENADQLRATMGDGAFFAKLNSGGGGGWGDLGGSTWDPASYAAARRAPVGSGQRHALLSAVVTTLLPAYASVARGRGEAYVGLDEGLAALSQHARDLGFSAVVLFLDEVVLWLASRIANLEFVTSEGAKLAKLVEAENADRPAPIVSFLARQRDLAELVGANALGAEYAAFTQAMQWWEGRFSVITLGDENLPVIASKRLLSPKDERARALIDVAFSDAERARQDVLDVLLTGSGDRQQFRLTYPFSPAFISTLVAVSGALQRERTGLRVLLQLLVDRRDDLELGEIVPVGDLYDVVSRSDQPFTEAMRAHFEAAKKLYATKLRPMLLDRHGLAEDVTGSLPMSQPFRTDDRLVKTLLLAALVPEAEPFRGLDAARLTALNHGTIKSPIAGRERGIVIDKLRGWAAEVGEVRVGEDVQNPSVSLQLLGVDTAAILDQARHADSRGERKRLLRTTLLELFGVPDRNQLSLVHELRWRGTRRQVELLFGNVRDRAEVPDSALRADGDTWKVVIDLPFDEEGYGPANDLARVHEAASSMSTRTVAWLPAFLSAQALRQLGDLVVLEHVLAGDRFDDYARNLPPADRQAARGLLDNQRSQLRSRMRSYLLQAYGVQPAQDDAIVGQGDLAERFPSLEPTLTVKPPARATLADALADVVDQCLSSQYPDHPRFEEEVRPAALRQVLEVVREAAADPDQRVVVAQASRKMMRVVANPLGLGIQSEQAFVLGGDWTAYLEKRTAEARQSGGEVTVGQARRWLDEKGAPMGLPREVGNLVLLTFLTATGRALSRHGGPVQGTVDAMPDDAVIVEVSLPEPGTWEAAQHRASTILGVVVGKLRNAGNVAELAVKAREVAAACASDARELAGALAVRAERLGVEPGCDRLRTAAGAVQLVQQLEAASGDGPIQVLADFRAPTSDENLGRSLKGASELLGVLRDTGAWDVIDLVLTNETDELVEKIRSRLRTALAADEFVAPLADDVRWARKTALAVLQSRQPDPPSVDPPVVPVPDPPPPGRVTNAFPPVIVEAAELETGISDVRRALEREGWTRVRITIEPEPEGTG